MKFTARSLESATLPTGKRQVFITDPSTPGLKLRITPGAKAFVFECTFGKRRRILIGPYGAWTIHAARQMATDMRAGMGRGIDPEVTLRGEERQGATLAGVWATYERLGHPKKNGERKAATTVRKDGHRWAKHVEPALGDKPVASITDIDLRRLQRDVERNARRDSRASAGGAGSAAQCVLLVRALLAFAQREGMMEHSVVGKSVTVRQSRKMERFLAPAEIGRLLAALDELKTRPRSRSTASALQLLALTGMRLSETTGLRWAWVDTERGFARLPTDKSGQGRPVPLSRDALVVIEGQRGLSDEWVFPSIRRPNLPVSDLSHVWAVALDMADLESVRIHDLRHSVASALAASGESLFVIGKVLGHRSTATTSRYAHLTDQHLADAVGRLNLRVVEGGRRG